MQNEMIDMINIKLKFNICGEELLNYLIHFNNNDNSINKDNSINNDNSIQKLIEFTYDINSH